MALILVAACADSGPPCDLDPALDGDQCAALHAMQLPADLPAARGNRVADSLDAAALGFQIFFDARFSSNQQIRCATCHSPEENFGDGLAKSMAQGPIIRNAPTVLNSARMRWQFWDGRADTLWSQPLFAFENPNEMNFPRTSIAANIFTLYRTPYEALFGAMPDPATATSDQIDDIAANVGKAIEAYERKLASGASPFDRFLAGDATALTDAQRRGMVAFAKNGCASCHSGPMLSDEQFYALGVPAWPGDPEDPGRTRGLSILAANEFNSEGRFFDGPDADRTPIPVATAADQGAFRTPSLRNVAISAPYGHNGRFSTLQEVIDNHAPIDPADRDDIATFLGALTGKRTGKPWNDWPGQ
jgi:cytochrome c peroxidase